MLKFRIINTNKKPDEVQRIIDAEYKRGMQMTVLEGERQIAMKTPVGVTGHTRQGIHGRIIDTLHGEIGIQGPAGHYGDFVERGRRAGKAPPPAPIELWLRRTTKGRVFVARIRARYKIKNEKTAFAQAVYLKQQGIAHRGTPGAFMFKESLRNITTAANKHFNEAVKKIEVKLSDK